jgi:hypothetical protein
MLYLTIIRDGLSWTRQVMIRKTWVIRPKEGKPMSSLTKKWIDHSNHEWIEAQELLGSMSCAHAADGRAWELTPRSRLCFRVHLGLCVEVVLFHDAPPCMRGQPPCVDITLAKYRFANIISLRVVQQKHCRSTTLHVHSYQPIMYKGFNVLIVPLRIQVWIWI